MNATTATTYYIDENYGVPFGKGIMKHYEQHNGDIFEEIGENAIPRVQDTFGSHRVPRLVILWSDDKKFRLYELVGKICRKSPVNYYYEFPIYRLVDTCENAPCGIGY